MPRHHVQLTFESKEGEAGDACGELVLPLTRPKRPGKIVRAFFRCGAGCLPCTSYLVPNNDPFSASRVRWALSCSLVSSDVNYSWPCGDVKTPFIPAAFSKLVSKASVMQVLDGKTFLQYW